MNMDQELPPAGETINGCRTIHGAFAQGRGRKVWFVRRVGIVLRLQAETGTTRIRLTGFADDRRVEKISGVELHAWLRGPNFHLAPAVYFKNYCGRSQC